MFYSNMPNCVNEYIYENVEATVTFQPRFPARIIPWVWFGRGYGLASRQEPRSAKENMLAFILQM